MADFMQMGELIIAMEGLKNRISSNLSDLRLIKFYSTVIDNFITFCKKKESCQICWESYVCRYYEAVTGAAPFKSPGSSYLKKKARAIFMIRDSLKGGDIKSLYRYNTSNVPLPFETDIQNYTKWLTEKGNSPETIKTRIGRIKVFLLEIEKAGCLSMTTLNVDLLINYISGLAARYSSAGKANILYTLRNYFTCFHIAEQLKYDLIPLLTNLHSNKHERLESFYTPKEIQQVLNTVDRNTKPGKMLYLMMLLACIYGLRSYDIKTLCFSNIDWNNSLINLIQNKTKQHLQLPLTEEVKYALLDYVKNARPHVAGDRIFIKIRAPHVPYSDNNHFSGKIKHCFKLAGINIEHKHAGLHSLRHSLASRLMSDKTPISEIAAILGHASVQATKQYIWSDITQLRAAALEVAAYDH